MGTEYCLGKHGDEHTPQGSGVSLMAYEMSGLFDVYIDLPKSFVDMDAWDDAARVNIWYKLSPDDLLRIGKNMLRIAKLNGAEDKDFIDVL